MKICWASLSLTVLLFLSASAQDFVTVQGWVTDSLTGDPIAGVTVTAFPQGTMSVSNAQGRYSLTRLAPGRIVLIFESAFHERRESEPLYGREGDRIESNVALPSILLFATEQEVVSIRETRSGLAIISRQRIEASGAADVGDLLREQGYYLTGDGKSEYVSLHGFRPEAVLVLLDGQPLNPDGGAADLSQIPTETIDRIEVYSSGAAAIFGANALGGAVNITSRKSGDHGDTEARLGTSLGTYGLRSHMAAFQAEIAGRMQMLAEYDYSHSSSDYNYEHPYYGDINRENNFSRSGSTYLSLTPSQLRQLNLSARLFSTHNGVPGAVLQETPSATAKREGRYLNASCQIRNLSVQAGYHELVQHYRGDDPLGQIDTRYLQIGRRLCADWSTQAFTGLIAEFGGQHLAESFFGVDLAREREVLPRVSRRTESLYGSLRFHKEWGRWDLNSEARYRSDRIDHNSYDSPYLGASLDYGDKLRCGIEGDYSESYRYPPIDALFWREDVFAIGNPDLRPERSEKTEWGVHLDWSGPIDLSLRALRFESDVSDLITWRRRFDGRYQPINVDETEIRGTESTLTVTSTDGHLECGYSRTSLQAINRSETGGYYGRVVPFQPDRVERFHLTLRAWLLSAGYWYSFTGKRFIREANTKWLPPYVLHDLQLSLNLNLFSLRQKLTIDWRNLSDERYELLERMPMPPETVTVSLQLEI